MFPSQAQPLSDVALVQPGMGTVDARVGQQQIKTHSPARPNTKGILLMIHKSYNCIGRVLHSCLGYRLRLIGYFSTRIAISFAVCASYIGSAGWSVRGVALEGLSRALPMCERFNKIGFAQELNGPV